MADLSFPYNKVSTFEEAFENVKTYVTPENIAKFKVKAKISYMPENKAMQAKGTGFTLDVKFDDEKVDLFLKLSFILKPIRKKTLSIMEKEFRNLV